MPFVDPEICKRACPFGQKGTGFCLRALVMRKPKEEVCVSTVPIRVKGKEYKYDKSRH